MRVLIQGPGAIGRFLAARFVLAGVPITLLDHDIERARFLEQQGILLSGSDRTPRRAQVSVLMPDEHASGDRRWQLLISCVKAHDRTRALRDGIGQAMRLRKERLSAVTGGLNLPGLF